MSVDVPFVAAAVVAGGPSKQLLVGIIADAELWNQSRRLLATELHHSSTAAGNDEHSGFRDAVVERIVFEAHCQHSPALIYPVSLVTMSISLSRLDPNGADRSSLIEFFTSNDFPFHVHAEPWTVAKAVEVIGSGVLRNQENEAFWLRHDTLGVIGYVRLEDLTDDTPMFDLRLGKEFRGRGLGIACLRAVTDHVFTTLNVDRFEGHTRDDNIAMRSTFVRAGWSKEAHYRRAWPVRGQAPRDSVAYAILREEWESGSSVDVHWHDLPMFTPHVEEDVEFTSNSVSEATELVDLYRSVGWTAYTQNPVTLRSSVLSSAHVVSARLNGELIGLARVVSDFASIVYLQDVLVHPNHHRRGVGRQLVTRVLAPFGAVRQKVLLTDTDPGQTAFYDSLGFAEASAAGRSDVRGFVKL